MSILLDKRIEISFRKADSIAAIGSDWGINISDRIAMLRKRIERPEFKLAIVGRFKTGKSTLINAMLGEEILPYDVLPCSACEVYIRNGPSQALRIEAADGTLQSAPITSLNQHVAVGGSELARRAELEVPSEFLERGICLIDTPGFDDVDQTRSEVVYSVLPDADAVIMVFDATAIGSTEEQFLRERVFKSTLSRYIFVLNKIDLIDESDRDEVVQYLRSLLSPHVPVPLIVCLSAQTHLQGIGSPIPAAKNADRSEGFSYRGVEGLVSLINTEIMGKSEEIMARVLDSEILGMKESLADQFAMLKDSIVRSDEEISHKVTQIQVQYKELEGAAAREEEQSLHELEDILNGSQQRLMGFVSKYKLALYDNIINADAASLRRPGMMERCIEKQFKDWLENEASLLENKLTEVFHEFDRRMHPHQLNCISQYGQGDLAMEKANIQDDAIMPALMLGGWLVLGWTNFIVLAAASHFGGDFIKQQLAQLINNEDGQKHEYAQRVTESLPALGDKLFESIAQKISDEFKQRLGARTREPLEQLEAQKKLLKHARVASGERKITQEAKLEKLNKDIERLATV